MQQLRVQVGRHKRGLARKADRQAAGGGVQIPESGGAALGGDVQKKMEKHLGGDLSGVRVHTGGDSAQAAGKLGARAFTDGKDIHFNAGQFSPGSKEGDRLLAHELTHVVQGQKSGIQRKEDDGAGDEKGGVEVSDPGDAAEVEADQVADKVADKEHDGASEAKGDEKDKKKKDGDADGEEGEKAEGEEKKAEEEPAPISAKLFRKVFRDPAAGEEEKKPDEGADAEAKGAEGEEDEKKDGEEAKDGDEKKDGADEKKDGEEKEGEAAEGEEKKPEEEPAPVAAKLFRKVFRSPEGEEEKKPEEGADAEAKGAEGEEGEKKDGEEAKDGDEKKDGADEKKDGEEKEGEAAEGEEKKPEEEPAPVAAKLFRKVFRSPEGEEEKKPEEGADAEGKGAEGEEGEKKDGEEAKDGDEKKDGAEEKKDGEEKEGEAAEGEEKKPEEEPAPVAAKLFRKIYRSPEGEEEKKPEEGADAEAKGAEGEEGEKKEGEEAKDGDEKKDEEEKEGEAAEGEEKKPEEEPAPVAAKLFRKVYRSPDPAATPPAAAGGAPATAAAPGAEPERTADQGKAELQSALTPAIEAGKGEPPVKLGADGTTLDNMKSDSADPIKLKDEMITLTNAYLALPKETPEAERKVKLDAIKAKFEALRAAMKHARGEDDKLTSLRVKFEKFIGAKAEGEWPQGVQCVESMCSEAKGMIASHETKAMVGAQDVDAKLQSLPEDLKEKIGTKIGTDINIGFAGVVGQSFEAIMEALTNGSLVQKAQGLIGFTDNYLVPKLMEGAGPVFEKARANLAEVEPQIELAKLIDQAKGKSAKEQKAILLTSPVFQAELAKVKKDNAGVDAERGAENDGAKLGGGMDTKIPEQPIENCDDQQLDFIAGEVNPKVDLKDCKTKEDKIKKLKEAGITTSKPKGAAVDATSITEAVDGVTVQNKAYIEGKLENIVDPKNSWIMDANKAKAPLKAGISGTTARFVGSANLLGGDKNGAAVAMLGHLQKIEAHSFGEIMGAASIGLPLGHYTPFPPNEPGMQAAASQFLDENSFADLGTEDKSKAQKTLLGEE